MLYISYIYIHMLYMFCIHVFIMMCYMTYFIKREWQGVVSEQNEGKKSPLLA